MKESRLGEFEEFVLITIGVLNDKAYSMSIKEMLSEKLERKISMGALHSALGRLIEKGFIKLIAPQKAKGINGRPKRYFSITASGNKIIYEVKDKRDQLWRGMQGTLLRKKYSPSPANAAIAETVKRIMPTMPSSELELILPILKRQVVKKNKFLLGEGDVYPNVYFIISGYLRMFFVDGDGHEINYKFVEHHHFITDFQSFLTCKPSRYFCQALIDTDLFVLSHRDIHTLYKLSPHWNNFGRLIGEGAFLQLNERVEMYLFMTPEERYQHLLTTRPQLFSQVSLSKLATYLGITAESLSRLRKRIRKK
jgi:CRP-like cAMP-binding protein